MTNPRDLVQLRALYQSGLLTEDEYTDARRRLLGYKVKRGRPVPPAQVPARPTSDAAPSGSPAPRRSLNAQTQPRTRGTASRGSRASRGPRASRASRNPDRNPNSDLPLIFALGALTLVAIAATVWFLIG